MNNFICVKVNHENFINNNYFIIIIKKTISADLER